MFIERPGTWEQAYSLCRQSSGNRAILASIGSSDENSFVSSLFSDKPGVNAWLGGTFLSTNRWAWINGSFWNGYTNWARRRGPSTSAAVARPKILMYGRCVLDPNRRCRIRSGTWNNESSETTVTGMVCEYMP